MRRIICVIFAALVASSTASYKSSAKAPALPFQCKDSKDFQIMIHVDGAFARALNTWKAPQVGRLLKFQCYKTVGRDGAGEWAWIEYGFGRVWVHRNDFRTNDGTDINDLKIILPEDLTPIPAPALRLVGIPTVSKSIKDLYKRAVKEGRDGASVSVMGDCNSESPVFFGRLAAGVVDLAQYPTAQRASLKFSPSFTRTSVATHGSFSAAMAFDSTWSDPKSCAAGEGPLACELRNTRASVIIISLGTGDTFTWKNFEGNLQKIVQYAIQNNAVPVLMTKADALESQQGGASPETINAAIRRVGAQYGIPVIDYALAVKNLPGGGLIDEKNTDGKQIEPFHINEIGMDARIIMTLQTLASISGVDVAPIKTKKKKP